MKFYQNYFLSQKMGPLCSQWLVMGILVIGFLTGCGNRSNLPGETGTLSGQVTFPSGTIPPGTVLVFVHSEKGIPATAVLDAQGKFKAMMRGGEQILVGDYQVNVTPPGNYEEGSMEVPEAWKAIPKKYWHAETSGETFAVNSGANSYLLELKN